MKGKRVLYLLAFSVLFLCINAVHASIRNDPMPPSTWPAVEITASVELAAISLSIMGIPCALAFYLYLQKRKPIDHLAATSNMKERPDRPES